MQKLIEKLNALICLLTFLVPLHCVADDNQIVTSDHEEIVSSHDEEISQVIFEDPGLSCDQVFGLGTGVGSGANSSKYPIVKLTGFFQADAAWFNQDAANIATVGNIQDGADFRRARLAARGSVAENVNYMIEFDFAFPGGPSFMDVWVELIDLPVFNNLRIGQSRMPMGMDVMTSVKELTFLERGLPSALLPFRQIGAVSSGMAEDELSTWAGSVFRYPTDSYGGQIGDDGGYGFAGRFTRLLIAQGQLSVHLGGGYGVVDPANDAVQYSNQPEFFVGEAGGGSLVPVGVPISVPAFVDTGVIPTSLANLINAELAATAGPFHAQAEFIASFVNRIGASNVGFYGFYAQAAWILTGEHRPYNRQGGVLGRVVPDHPFGDCGMGAWEVAGRYSMLDLNDDDITGGKLQDLTFGMNWYLNQFTKFQFNFIHAMLQQPVTVKSNADIFAVRAQVDF